MKQTRLTAGDTELGHGPRDGLMTGLAARDADADPLPAFATQRNASAHASSLSAYWTPAHRHVWGQVCRSGARGVVGTEDLIRKGVAVMPADQVTRNLQSMDDLDFKGWNGADWEGVFAHYHTDDVLVDVHGQPQTHGVREHIDAMKAFVETTGGTPIQITSHPIGFGTGEWTCVVGEFEGGGRMVTVAKWRDGAIAEEYIWM